jgi:hypothetical protein
MTLVSSPIPNLVNGVSQQPDILRLPSQCDELVNALPSVVEGLRKRPPTRHRFRVSPAGSGFSNLSTLTHLIEDDSGGRYLAFIAEAGIRVFDLNTNSQVTVRLDSGTLAYLDCNNPLTDIRAITVADFTFILNRRRQVRALPDLVPKYQPEALIWVKQGAYGGRYEVTLDGIRVTFLTASRAATTTEWADGARWLDENGNVTTNPRGYKVAPPRQLPQNLTPDLIATDFIARQLNSLLSQNPTLSSRFTFTRSGSMIRVRRNGTTTSSGTNFPDFSISSTDSLGDTMLWTFKDRVQKFTDLPRYCFNNFRIKVAGDDATEFDDYYVRYEGNTTGGVWVEDIADEQQFRLDPATMIHALVRQADGTFLFRRLDWEPRKAGDRDSNPMPSIVGASVQDIFFYRDRLGFVGRQNVVMSRYGEYFNLFKASATTILDTDPIDVSISHTKATNIHHAVPYAETLVLFCRDVQFQIAPVDLLTPKTVAFNQTTEFDADINVRPVGSGSFLYFPQTRGRFSSVREYFVDKETATKDAEEITQHVPKYLPGAVVQVAVSTAENTAVFLANNARSELGVYNFYFDGDRKVQSAWHKWAFNSADRIQSISMLDSQLFITFLRNGELVCDSMDLSPGAVDFGLPHLVHLDRRFEENQCSVTYDGTNDRTVITPPFTVTTDMVLVAKEGNPQSDSFRQGRLLFRGYVEGELVEYTVNNNGQLIVPFELQRFWFGRLYEMRHRFSVPYLRQQSQYGDVTARVDGRFQLRRLSLAYVDSGYFDVEVRRPKGGGVSVYSMTARVIGDNGSRIGRVAIDSGSFNVPLMGRNDNLDITIKNDSILPSTFVSGQWAGNFTTKVGRIG